MSAGHWVWTIGLALMFAFTVYSFCWADGIRREFDRGAVKVIATYCGVVLFLALLAVISSGVSQ